MNKCAYCKQDFGFNHQPGCTNAPASSGTVEGVVRTARVWPSDLLRAGCPWLAAAREWMQWKRINGSDVTWGSNDELRPTMTVRDVEELAAHVAAAVMNQKSPNIAVSGGGGADVH